mmetsp:Transcript_14556/g.15730  ORF Transcript_14556/g.15730 Transcript_14556/m.15730 type:complete len:102 (-) Transcript_14556:37-342(-)
MATGLVIKPTVTAKSLMRGRRFEPCTERMLNAGKQTPTTQHGTAEPTLLLHPDQHNLFLNFAGYIEVDFFSLHSTRVRDNTGVGSFLTADIACTRSDDREG